MSKCNYCLLAFLKKQKYLNGFNVDLMICSTVSAFKQSKACFATISAFTEQSLCAIPDKKSMHYQYRRKQLGSCNSCYKDSTKEFAKDTGLLSLGNRYHMGPAPTHSK